MKKILEHDFFRDLKVSDLFFCAEQVGEKSGKFQKPEKNVFLKVVVRFSSPWHFTDFLNVENLKILENSP